jgi:hypothetical protein
LPMRSTLQASREEWAIEKQSSALL